MYDLPLLDTLALMQPLDDKLIGLLRSLSNEEWEKPTYAGAWRVKDIAAHLLDGNLRTLSMLRDGYFGEDPGPIDNYRELLGFLNGLNAGWVKAMRRISPPILIDLLESSGRSYCAYLAGLDPLATAAFAVAWAGETISPNWFHIAREYTEKWHHQQQIRAAVGKEKELYEAYWYKPYLETSLRALPYHYRGVTGENGNLLCIRILEKAWYLRFDDPSWVMIENPHMPADCTVTIPPEIAWRIFSKSIPAEEAGILSQIEGKSALSRPFFDMRAVMV